jgi:iron complex transport system substrate-binding protein
MTASRRRVFACLAGAVAAALCAVVRAEVAVRDGTGAAVALPHPAARIVTLAPHAAELVYAAGAGSKLVGVLAHSDWPAEARSLPRVGDAAGLDVERIVALKPDLVVTWPYTVPAQVAKLRSFGIGVYTTDARSTREITDDVERLATLAGTSAAAAPVVADMRARTAALAHRRDGLRVVRVFYQLGDRPMYTVGSPQLITQALQACGGANVFGAVDVAAPLVNVEAVLASRPEAILAGTEHARHPPWLDAWKAWPAVPAVRAGNLYAVDAMLLHRPGPRFLDGVEQLCATLDRARAALARKGI